ncbi:MAG: Crp/Fnr family transcriptional regulator, partial [Vicinamibacterales bacterium]
TYTRGRIDVLDRPGVERAACECYSVVKREFDRLLADVPKGDPFHALGESVA